MSKVEQRTGQENAMTLRLSEAIRLGAMMKPQAFEMYHDNLGGSCAIGAAFDAVGVNDGIDEATLWPIIRMMDELPCPACSEVWEDMMIPHLNDDHKWSRERIADWVETIEAQQEQVDTEREWVKG